MFVFFGSGRYFPAGYPSHVLKQALAHLVYGFGSIDDAAGREIKVLRHPLKNRTV